MSQLATQTEERNFPLKTSKSVAMMASIRNENRACVRAVWRKSRDTVTLILQTQFIVVYIYTLDEVIPFPYTKVLIV